jgi:hypothetical protein
MFGRLHATRKTGAEAFTLGETPLGFTVFDFWRWSTSDLVSNATRGRIAEFLVARALGVDGGIRNEWDAYDLTTASHLRVEVKSSAYLQSWAQRVVSSISFDIRETVAWDADSNTFASRDNRRRQADVYVFALLAHRTKATLNPLDVSQWDFFLLETSILNQYAQKQRRISLERLVALNALRCSYSELRSLIEGVEARRCSSQL